MIKLWKSKINYNKSGYMAEFICRMYMRFKGYRIIEKNYKCGSGKKTPYGEIDFIALKNKRLYFCEVKKRKNNKDFLSAISKEQQKRIVNGSFFFMKHHKKYNSYLVQFDVFFVKLPFSIKRIENAFNCDKIY